MEKSSYLRDRLARILPPGVTRLAAYPPSLTFLRFLLIFLISPSRPLSHSLLDSTHSTPGGVQSFRAQRTTPVSSPFTLAVLHSRSSGSSYRLFTPLGSIVNRKRSTFADKNYHSSTFGDCGKSAGYIITAGREERNK